MLSIITFCCILFFSQLVQAECFLNCAFQKGTVCINNECVAISSGQPTPTPSPTVNSSEIQLQLVPEGSTIINTIDCSKMNMKNIKLMLKRKTPPSGFTYFYSGIFITQGEKTDLYTCKKDLLNKYVFVPVGTGDTIKPQYYGPDFSFNIWTNPAFNDFFATKTCAELKVSGMLFNCGFSTNEARSDYESASFIFK